MAARPTPLPTPDLRYQVVLNSAPVGTVLRASTDLDALAWRVVEVGECWAVSAHAGLRTTAQLRALDSGWQPVTLIPPAHSGATAPDWPAEPPAHIADH